MSLHYPVLAVMPDFSKPPVYGVQVAHDTLANAFGPARVAFPQEQADTTFAFAFTLTSAAEIDELEAFFTDRCGRARPFYLPSWRQDLPQASAAAGDRKVSVAVADYKARHLTYPQTRPDHYGRQIFIWQPGQELFTSAVVGASPLDTGTRLQIETPLPFAVDPRLAVCGFAHLARFSEDELNWKFMTPGTAALEVRFRGIRQHQDLAKNWTIGALQLYASPGFRTAAVDGSPPTPATNREAFAPGPGGQTWAAWQEAGAIRTGQLLSVSYPATGGTVSPRSGGDVSTTHMALAYDKTNQQVIALQKGENVELRTPGGTFTFEGHTPLLINNQLISLSVDSAATDVVCYYIKPGVPVIYARFERDAWAVERIAARLPFRVLALKRTYVQSGVQIMEAMDESFRRAILQ